MKKIDFCRGWQFAESGKEWQPVTVPHDATQFSGRDAMAPSGSGGAYYLGGCYEYTKAFDAPAEWQGQAVSLLFEGVYPRAKVLLNGREIGGCAYGYSQFAVPLDGLRYGEENEITVIADNTDTPNSRWYAGAGIFRPVWLVRGNAEHIPLGGLRVTTLSHDPAVIRVETQVIGQGDIRVEIRDGKTIVAQADGNDVTLEIADEKLWSAEHPHLYTCKATLRDGDTILDEAETVFGIRTLTWSTEGFFVNGKKTLLKGGCVHSDNGILGSRAFDEAEWRRIRILKKWGFNAIRSAHNPLCRAALEACDALGMYVMDETWDMWDKHKTSGDYAGRFPEHWRTDVREMVAKDYNHPSVILYSIGNEVTEPAKPEGVELAAEIIREVKLHDSSRPVTAGINITLLMMAQMGINVFAGDEKRSQPQQEADSTAFNEMAAQSGARMVMAAACEQADRVSAPVLDQLDIAGYNYAQSRYESEREVHPGRIIVGSETYPQDLPGNWALVQRCPWVIGDFMWTAWDYLGEVGIGGWVYDPKDMAFAKPYPWKLADTGALDILGHDNAEAGLAAAVWGASDKPYIAVRPMSNHGKPWAHAMWRGSNAIPSWSWKGCEGRETEVEIYTRAREVALFLNGQSLGKQLVCDCKAMFKTVWQPGEIKAVAMDDDGTQTESVLRSATGDARIVIRPENEPQIGKILFVDISLRGENGEIESHADEILTVSVRGGELLAFGSADPKTEETFHSGSYPTYYGRSLAAIRITDAEAEITASGAALGAETLCLCVK